MDTDKHRHVRCRRGSKHRAIAAENEKIVGSWQSSVGSESRLKLLRLKAVRVRLRGELAE